MGDPSSMSMAKATAKKKGDKIKNSMDHTNLKAFLY
jgi:hypothetical protein